MHPSFVRKVDASNCVNFYNQAETLEYPELFNLCYRCMQVHIEDIVRGGDIAKLSFEHLKQLLTDVDLCVDVEETVWNAIAKWVEGNQAERISCVPSLMKCVRLEVCTEDCIRKMMCHPFVLKNSFFDPIFTRNWPEDRRKINLKQHFVESFKNLVDEPVPLGLRQSVIRAAYKEAKYNDCAELSLISDQNKTIAEIPLVADFFTQFVSCCGEKIFMFGYIIPQSAYIRSDRKDPKYLCLDLVSNSWYVLPSPVPEAESPMEKCVFLNVSDRIYALWEMCPSVMIAHLDHDSKLKSWKWISCPSLTCLDPGSQLSFAATAHEGLIHTVGAVETIESLKVFGGTFDPKTGTWSIFPHHLSEEHNGLSVVLPNITSRFFAIASFGSLLVFHGSEARVERFSPEEGIWRSFQDLPHTYRYPDVQIRNGALIVSERGHSNLEEARALCRDEQGGQWREGAPLLKEAARHVIEGDAAVRKYHRKLMDIEWKALLKEWK